MKTNLQFRAILILIIAFVGTSCTREIVEDLAFERNISFIPSWSGSEQSESKTHESTKSANLEGKSLDKSSGVINLNGDIEAYLLAETVYGIGSSSEFVSETLPTRAAPVTEESMYEIFGVSAYSYTDTLSIDEVPNFFHDATAALSGVGIYDLTSPQPWPGASFKVKFFAYAPKFNAQYVISDATQAGPPTITAAISEDVSKQECLLVAKSDEINGDNNATVSLTFDHTLTAIRFVCGEDMQRGSIKRISLKDVYYKGVYNMGTGLWSVDATKTTFTQELNTSITGANGEVVTTEAQTFMMLPQLLPDGAQIEVIFTDSTNVDHTFKANLNGYEWQKGTTVTYKLSCSPINCTYVLDVPDPIVFTYAGGNSAYQVSSYKMDGAGNITPIGWTTQFSEDGGETWTDVMPDWITDFIASGQGGEADQSGSATVKPQEGVVNNIHTDNLANNPEIGSAGSPYNLANSTGGAEIQNTANCYVVNAPGYYSFPLVYGNAIKGSAANSSAYTSNASNPSSYEGGGEVLRSFINHAGTGITDPYLVNNGCTPDKAELIWQDASSLVTNIAYNNAGSNGGNITFEVNRSTIQQGNAVIAIKDANDIVLWSWHIWVTDYILGDSLKTVSTTGSYSGSSYTFLPVSIGWCNGYEINYPGRTCKVKFISDEGGKEIVKEITQSPAKVSIGGNSPYYQWGRKDPFQPTSGLGYDNKSWYDKNGTSSNSNPVTDNLGIGATCIQQYIQRPNVFQNNYMGDDLYCNLWSAANNVYTVNNNTVIKTIYDPSPIGYCMPASAAFTGFTTTGGRGVSMNQINGTWDNVNKVWNFNADGGVTIKFPLLGYRNKGTGEILNLKSNGFYWTSIPSKINYGRYLILYSNTVVPAQNGNNRDFGYPVFSCKETN